MGLKKLLLLFLFLGAFYLSSSKTHAGTTGSCSAAVNCGEGSQGSCSARGDERTLCHPPHNVAPFCRAEANCQKLRSSLAVCSINIIDPQNRLLREEEKQFVCCKGGVAIHSMDEADCR